jgi:cytochrome P450
MYPGLFQVRRIMPTSTSAIQHILNNWTLYIKPEQLRVNLSANLGDGLLVAEGEMHKRQRKVLTPAFAVGYVREIVPIFWDKATALADKLQARVASQTPQGIDVDRDISLATLDIIGSAGTLLTTLIRLRI